MNQTQLQKLISLLTELLTKYKRMLKDLKTPSEILYKKAKESIGRDMAPIHNIFGCAEAVNNIAFLSLGMSIGGDVSTYRMIKALKSTPTRFKPVSYLEAKRGDIIISPTGHGSGELKNGHVGIISDNWKIMSNNSYNGKWEENYTWDSWVERYRKKGGFPIYLFRVIS